MRRACGAFVLFGIYFAKGRGQPRFIDTPIRTPEQRAEIESLIGPQQFWVHNRKINPLMGMKPAGEQHAIAGRVFHYRVCATRHEVEECCSSAHGVLSQNTDTQMSCHGWQAATEYRFP